jgi:hypothetical protein
MLGDVSILQINPIRAFRAPAPEDAAVELVTFLKGTTLKRLGLLLAMDQRVLVECDKPASSYYVD